jgi:Ni/Co efflux regulator RcnB
MTSLTRITAVAVFAAAAWAGASSFTPAAAAPQEGLTQELSAACRTVVSSRWSNGRRVTTRKRVCTPSYGYRTYGYRASCRYVTQTRWSNGRRVTVRTRVC